MEIAIAKNENGICQLALQLYWDVMPITGKKKLCPLARIIHTPMELFASDSV
jgi:hypothetical protein